MSGIFINKNDLEECTKIVKIGRRKKVYFSTRSWYFMWNGRRVKSSDIFCLNYPIMFSEADGKLTVIGYYLPVSNCITILISIDTDTDTIQMYRELDQ